MFKLASSVVLAVFVVSVVAPPPPGGPGGPGGPPGGGPREMMKRVCAGQETDQDKQHFERHANDADKRAKEEECMKTEIAKVRCQRRLEFHFDFGHYRSKDSQHSKSVSLMLVFKDIHLHHRHQH